MSAINDFLIKNAGMEKEARTALAKRLLASTMTPDEVLKRFGKVKGQRYLDDIETAAKNYLNNSADDSSPLSRIRSFIGTGAANQLHFNNRISKNDYLRLIESEAPGWARRRRYSILRSAGRTSGLKDIYSTLPRQDRLIVSKYLRGMVPDSSIHHLPNQTQQAARAARQDLLSSIKEEGTKLSKKQYAPTLQQEYGIKSREELLNELQSRGIEYNPEALQHAYYVTGGSKMQDMPDAERIHALLAATKLPFTSPDRLPAQIAALNDVLSTSGKFNSMYTRRNMNRLPRSVQKALQLIEGKNLLEPGTPVNRLFNKVYNNENLRNKLNANALQEYVDGENAAYLPDINALLVSPKWEKNMAGIEAHERGHFAAYNMPPDKHADSAFRTFRKMHTLGNRYKMNVPLDNPGLMQEAFAESYIPKLLGPNSGAASFTTPKQRLRDLASDAVSRSQYRDLRKTVLDHYRRNEAAINAMRTSEDTKDLFRQLAFSYGHELV